MFNKLVYQNERMQVYENEKGWARFENTACPGAAIIVEKPDGAILMVNEKRFLHRNLEQQSIWNIPRGGTEPEETPHQTAQRELREETGLDLPRERISHVAKVRPDTGMFLGYVDVFHIQVNDNEAEKIRPQDGEIDSVSWFSIEQLKQMLKAGDLEDSYTLTALGILNLIRS